MTFVYYAFNKTYLKTKKCQQFFFFLRYVSGILEYNVGILKRLGQSLFLILMWFVCVKF